MNFLIMALSITAHAAIPSITCTNPERLNSEVQSCDGNSRYGEAGLSCTKQFEQLVQQQAGAASKKMGASNAGVGSHQAQNFSGAASDYNISKETLDELIRAGEHTKTQVEAYLQNIVYPEDFDAPPAVIGDPIEFLDKEGCYSENRDGLENLLDTIDDHLEDLAKAKAASVARQDTSSGREGNLNNSLVKGAASTKAQGAKVPSGKSQNGASDVTGTKPKRK